ncbi:hypothetical protein [Micromonospora sp. NPDC049301]
MIVIACVLLVDPDGQLLVRLRDGNATYHPNVWPARSPPRHPAARPAGPT